jgi:predicted transcriptional regulator
MIFENYLDAIDDPGERVREFAMTVASHRSTVAPFVESLGESPLTIEAQAVHESLRQFHATKGHLFSGLLPTLHRTETFLIEEGDVLEETVVRTRRSSL